MEEALQFMTLAASRYSVRQFSDRNVDAKPYPAHAERKPLSEIVF